MQGPFPRRRFLASLGVGLGVAAEPGLFAIPSTLQPASSSPERFRLSLNAYSFNESLRSGGMTLDDLVDFAVRMGFDGLDATGYYFTGYPTVPPDEELFSVKRRGFEGGLVITGTGVRNDFAVADPEARRRDVQLVKNWIEVASKLGAGVIRIFSGRNVPDGHSFEQTLQWMAHDIRECSDYAARHGVLIGIQNHNDFLKTAAQTIRLVEAVDSPWCRVILDVGSLRQAEPYGEIEQLIPYAASWQLKEYVWEGGAETSTDLARIRRLIERAGYRGFLSLETLGPGDPKMKVERFLGDVRRIFALD